MIFIDLGLASGTKWLDCYNSNLVFFDDFKLLTKEQFKFYRDHIPTVEQFEELGRSCKIKKYNKGGYGFLLITGPNGNKIRILESVWHHKGTGIRLLNYWINGEFFNTDNSRLIPENINACCISDNIYTLVTYKRKFANIIFVDV